MTGWILGGFALKGTIVLAAAWLITATLRRRSAAARHLVWTAASAAVLSLPFLSVGLPAWQLPIDRGLLPVDTGLVFRVFGTASADPGAASPTAATSSSQPGIPARPRRDWRPLMLGIWAAGSAAMLLQMLAACAALWRARRRARPFPETGQSAALSAMLDLHDPVSVLETKAGTMPMNFGLLRPVVFLPEDARQWPQDRLRMVLLHELAHVRRGDVATHLLARLALTLHWWNPLAWIAWREFIKERERATDDLVLSVGARASEYASHLLEIARSMQSPAPTAWAAVAMARPSQLEGRLLAILDSRIHRAASTRLAPLAAASLAVALMAPFAAVRAQDSARQPVPPDVDATIRAAAAQKNHEILERAASVYEGLKNYDVAQSLLENALAIRGERTGQQGAEYAAGLVKLGDLAYKRRQYDEANAFYAKAAALGDRPETASALFHLGIKSYRDKDVNSALDFFQRAYNVDPKGPQAGPALTWIANARQLEPATENEADQLYQRALALEDPGSVEAATTMEFYSFFLRKHDRITEAVPLESRAQEVRRGLVAEMLKKEFGSDAPQPNFRVNADNQINIVRPPGAPTNAPVPAQPRTASGAYRVGSGVLAPRLLYKIEPKYTEEARAMKFQGTVMLAVEIGVNGRASNIQVIKGLGLGLDENAADAVTSWVFQPGMLNGQAVPVMATIEVNFRLM